MISKRWILILVQHMNGLTKKITLILACFRQSVVGRHLANNLILKSWTAYTLDECKQFCLSESTFLCRGFAFRCTMNLHVLQVYNHNNKRRYSRAFNKKNVDSHFWKGLQKLCNIFFYENSVKSERLVISSCHLTPYVYCKFCSTWPLSRSWVLLNRFSL